MNIQFPMLLFFCLMLTCFLANSQNNPGQDSIKGIKIRMTSQAFGGTGLSITKVNNQLTVMTGGRGAATFNNRYTFGGGGWGMPVGVELGRITNDTLEFFKFGYGGLEFGYIIIPNEKIKMGTRLMAAYGAGFKESNPKGKNVDFSMFPVLEPSLYAQISLGRLMRFDMGVSYRFVTGMNSNYPGNNMLSGLSCYMVLVMGTCKCN